MTGLPIPHPARLALVFCLLSASLGVVRAGPQGLAAAELERRSQAAAEARRLLEEGDVAYREADYANAVTNYGRALQQLPAAAPAVAELRAAAVDRFAQAAIERAKDQRRLGDLEGARESVERVLAEEVAPDHIQARGMLERIEDPIHTNPASSPEHTADVDEVRRLLYTAEGAYELGQFDRSLEFYREVLRVDPYNRAARRGMERVDAARRDYYRAAYDQTRSEMLAEVDRAWEQAVNPADRLVPAIGEQLDQPVASTGLAEKLERIELPRVQLQDVTLEEAVEFLRVESAAQDQLELDPTQRGVNFVIDVPQDRRAIRFDLNLRNVTLGAALEYVTEATNTMAVVQPFAVAIRVPGGGADEGLEARTYRVPPDFLTAATGEGGDDVAANDPFAPEPDDGGLVARRLSAEEVLKSRGVSFPPGASASFSPGDSTLRVNNTPTNHLIVEQIVSLLAEQEPTAVVVEVKVIRTQQQRLRELGFDWLLTPFGLSANSTFLGGGTIGSGQSRTNADFLSPVDGVTIPGVPTTPGADVFNTITGGNRSGQGAISGNSIDALINNPDRTADSASPAPGILSLTGLFSDGEVQLIMRGLDQKRGVDLNAVPSVVTRSGQAASIEIIREFIYPTEYEPPEIPNSVGGGGVIAFNNGQPVAGGGGGNSFPVTPATPTSFETRNTGITLEVLPTVSNNKQYVDLSLTPDITEFDGFVNYGSPIFSPSSGGLIGGVMGGSDRVEITANRILMPVFSRLRTTTALSIADGATLTFGGLLQERIENVEDSVPILGDIPVVGRLFQSKASSPRETAIVFMVKVRVVDGGGRPFNP